MNSDIVLYNFETVAGKFEIPIDNSLIPLNEATKNSISNAWEECAVFDEFGRVWIISDKIHVLLRTSKENAKYIVGGISDNNKYRDGDILYIRGSEIYKILDETLQNARSFRRENYIRFSELFYRAIRDSDRGCLLRTAFYEHLNRTIGSLKQKRIKVFALQYDELTGEILEYQSCEFSHIRSVSLFPQFASLIENGLIVNKKTHEEITRYNINDEDELYNLCELKGWSLEWYKGYLK